MTFILITFFAAFLIEGLGTAVSVIGLSTLFGANPIIISLAVALDVGKLVVVTLLYTYWKQLSVTMRSYALFASIVTMTITSAGSAGYLSARFQEAVIGVQENALKVDVLKQEQTKLETRKKQIDDSIAAIPDKYTASQKIRLMNQYKDEQKQVNARLNDLSQELPKLQIDQIGREAKAGPILYIAKAFNVTVEAAVKYVILLIIFVFDPLAVFLIIAGNFLLHQRRVNKVDKVSEADLFAEPPRIEPDKPWPRTEEEALAADLEKLDIEPPTWNETLIAKEPVVSEEAAPVAVEEPMPELDPVPEATPVSPEEPPVAVETVVEPTPEPEPEVFHEVEPEPVVEPAPVTEPTAEERERITLEQLRPFHSSLNDVTADETMSFDPTPRNNASRTQYLNYSR